MGWKDYLFGSKNPQPHQYEQKNRPREEVNYKKEESRAKPTEIILKPEDFKEKSFANPNDNNVRSREDERWNMLESKRFIRTEDKDAIVFVIENNAETRSFKTEILGLAKKIIESNKECFFLMIRMGDNKKSYGMLDYETLNKKEIFKDWFTEGSNSESDYISTLNEIFDFYRSTISTIEIEDTVQNRIRKYLIQNTNIVFVGSGNIPTDKEIKSKCTKLLKSLKDRMRVKSVKYFCLKDNQTINVAKLGFPVIGHIETDFYK